MCGIAGCFGSVDTDTVNRMLDALGHRGPDDRGIYVFNNTVLGHTRLSIVDVARGHQPILSNDGRVHAYNLELPANKAAALLLGDPFPEWKVMDMPEEKLKKYAGIYRIDEDNTREFIVDDGRAYTSRNGRPRLDIYPASDSTFFYTLTLHYIEFEMDEAGVPVKMILHRDSGADQVAERER